MDVAKTTCHAQEWVFVKLQKLDSLLQQLCLVPVMPIVQGLTNARSQHVKCVAHARVRNTENKISFYAEKGKCSCCICVVQNLCREASGTYRMW